MPILETRKFGTLTVPDDKVFTFPQGLPGFPGASRFVLLPDPGGAPFQWLQSATRPELSLVVADPLLIVPGYRAEVRTEDLDALGLASIEDGFVLVILTVPKDPMRSTANLLGPLVFSPQTLRALQVVQSHSPDLARVAVFGAA